MIIRSARNKPQPWSQIMRLVILVVIDLMVESWLLASALHHLIPNVLSRNVVFKIIGLGIMVLLNSLLTQQKIYWHFKPTTAQWRLIVIGVVFAIVVGAMHVKNIGTALVVGVIAAVPEEYLCRGVIFAKLLTFIPDTKHNYGAIVWMTLINALFFAFYHLGNLRTQSIFETVVQMIQVFGLAFLLAAAYLKTGSIVAPMLIHFLVDFTVTVNNGFAGNNTHLSWSTLVLIFSMVYGVLYMTVAYAVAPKRKLSQFKLLDQLE